MRHKAAGVALLSLVGLLFALSLPQSCLACSCAAPPTPAGGWTREALLTQSDLIFRGTVVSSGPLRVLGSGYTDGTYTVTFQVSEVWKGDVPRSVEVGAGQGGGDCTIPFHVGDEWLIYGDRNSSGVVRTSICARTSQLPGGWHANDLAVLAAGTPVPLVDTIAPSTVVPSATVDATNVAGVTSVQPQDPAIPGAQALEQNQNGQSGLLWAVVAAGVLALVIIAIVSRRWWTQ